MKKNGSYATDVQQIVEQIVSIRIVNVTMAII